MSKDKVLNIVMAVLTVLVMVTKAIQAGCVIDCTSEEEM